MAYSATRNDTLRANARVRKIEKLIQQYGDHADLQAELAKAKKDVALAKLATYDNRAARERAKLESATQGEPANAEAAA